MTFLRGRVLLRDGRLEQAPGAGRYLVRGGPRPPLGVATLAGAPAPAAPPPR
jgi:hypothetical protein